MEGILYFWVIGFIVSISFLVSSIDDYKKGKKGKRPIIISGIVSFGLCVPIVLVVVLLIGLSTGLVSM